MNLSITSYIFETMIAIIISIIALIISIWVWVKIGKTIKYIVETYDTQIDRIYKQMAEQGRFVRKKFDEVELNLKKK